MGLLNDNEQAYVGYPQMQVGLKRKRKAGATTGFMEGVSGLPAMQEQNPITDPNYEAYAQGKSYGELAQMGLLATPAIIRAGVPLANKATEIPLRSRMQPVFNSEVAVTNPAILQNVALNNPTQMALSRDRLNLARTETGSPYAQGNISASQGAWNGSNGFESNPVFMQQFPAHKGNVADQGYMKYAAQTSENLTQDANGVARFVPHLLNDTRNSNAAMLSNITPEQLKKLGEAGLTEQMVIAARPGNKALIMGFDDSKGQVPELMKKIQEIVPDAKFKTGVSNNAIDRVYMTRSRDEFGNPTYADFGATPRNSGLLDVMDERLRKQGN